MSFIGLNGSCPYDIGDILYSSNNKMDPNLTYKGTTWERIKGRVIVGVDESQAEFNTMNKTGGTKTHSHTTGSLALTVAQMPSHSHGFNGLADRMVSSGTNYVVRHLAGENHDAYINSTGGSQSHNHGDTGSTSNLMPYITKYVWERTA